MRAGLHAIAAMAAGLTFYCAAAPAREIPQQLAQLLAQRGSVNNSLPKGSYQQSCTCQMSGGVTLLCMCANPEGKYFETTYDVRNCTLPKDIRNCFGKLVCVDPKGAQAAALGGECYANDPPKAPAAKH